LETGAFFAATLATGIAAFAGAVTVFATFTALGATFFAVAILRISFCLYLTSK